MMKFICNTVLSQFSNPIAFVLDNGTQFVGQKVKNILDELKIEFYNSTLSYLQYNRQFESSKKIIMSGIKRRPKKTKGEWVEELPSILWAY